MNNEKIGKIMKKIKKAQRLNSVLPSPIRKTFAIANEMKSRGEKILDFGIGDIDIFQSPLPGSTNGKGDILGRTLWGSLCR